MPASLSRRIAPSLSQHFSAGDRLRIHAYELLEVAHMMDSPALSVVASDARTDMVEQIAGNIRAVVRG